ncbi:MAG: hypothetical protein M3Z22_06575 [Verrucomicrobiota bacterium]|nr:hypothetical protein [Verrucomicrobiota bacterium]
MQKTAFVILRFCLCAALLTILAASADARGKKVPGPGPVHVTLITSVTADSITISEDKVPKTYTITPFTEITVRGQRAKITDLQPGMSVSVTLGDQTRLSRINAGDAIPQAKGR